jgi:subtilisin family serine protease
MLTDEQAKAIVTDERVYDVEAIRDIEPAEPTVIQPGLFSIADDPLCESVNWGLINQVRRDGADDSDIDWEDEEMGNTTYEYTLDGTGVDVVIIDSGVVVDHPEWMDADGNSRYQQIRWNQAAPQTLFSSGFYNHDTHYAEPTDDHGTHVASILAGRTHGWAKNAHIYSIRHGNLSGTTGGIQSFLMYDVITEWHNNKNNPAHASFTGRPTVVNMSYGNSARLVIAGWTGQNSPGIVRPTISDVAVQTVRYRGTITQITDNSVYSQGRQEDDRGSRFPYESSDAWVELGFQENMWANSDGVFKQFTTQINSVDIPNVSEMVDAGIHICTAAGNSGNMTVHPGHEDYNNYIETSQHRWYYMRGDGKNGFIGGTSRFNLNHPDDWDNTLPEEDTTRGFMVGNIFNLPWSGQIRAYSSTTGPAVNIWAAGSEIRAATNFTECTYVDEFDETGNTTVKTGTSMASPQVAGIVACTLQLKPSWTPNQIYRHMQLQSIENLSDATWLSGRGLLGSTGAQAHLSFSNTGRQGEEISNGLFSSTVITDQARSFRITTS